VAAFFLQIYTEQSAAPDCLQRPLRSHFRQQVSASVRRYRFKVWKGATMQLENRVAIITGAGRGIGRAIALAYAKEGARLALAARTLSELEEMVRQTLERFSAIDILVNNAFFVGPIGPLQDNDVSEWIRTFQVNVFGTFFCCRAVLPVMLRQGRGKIINVTSATRALGDPAHIYRYLAAYFSSKVAVTQLTESLSYQLAGTNIQVNAMHPSGLARGVEEAWNRLNALGEWEPYEEVTSRRPDLIQRSADLAVFLASDASGSLGGRIIRVNDDFSSLPPRIPEIMASDAYTLRRVELE
jgi:NAD(P)-dependent dehydrogenase (short-subunit alcohol dehydrogenase family)